MQVRSLKGTMCRQAVLSCLGAATWLWAMAPFPAAAEQKADEDARSAESRAARKQPPTTLATMPFLVHFAPPEPINCSAVNLGSTPRDVTITLRLKYILPTPPIINTITLQPNAYGGLATGSHGGNRLVPPYLAFCEFQSSDVTLIRASASVDDGHTFVPAN